MLLCNDEPAGTGPKYAARRRTGRSLSGIDRGVCTMLARGRFSSVLTGFAVAAFAALAPAAAEADALADVMKAKVIKVAVPQDFAPFGSAGPDLKPVGYDIDMANLI